MNMQRKEIIKSLNKLMMKISSNLKAAGISEPEQQRFIKTIDKKSDEQIVEYIERVMGLTHKGGAYYEFMAIYGLRHAQWWENMSLLGETNLREHKLRNVASKQLRLAWRELHVQEKATTIDDPDQRNLEGSCDRPS
jgi:hypothetical protein